MPSRELFEAQTEEYRELIIPNNVRNRVVVEAASSYGWHKYAGIDGKLVTIDEFGTSAPGSEVFKYFGITAEKRKKST